MNRLSNKVKTLVFFYMEDELDDEFEIYRIATFPYKKGDIIMINRIIMNWLVLMVCLAVQILMQKVI